MEYGFLSLFPPLVAIVLALLTRRVIIALFSAIFIGFLLQNPNPFGAIFSLNELMITLLAKGWVVKSLIFAVLIGAILHLSVASGGVNGLVYYLTTHSQKIQSKRGALLLGYILGIVVFIESTITSLVVGALTRPLSARFGASGAKVAYICDATSAPVCSLFPLNGWGALLSVLIAGKIAEGVMEGSAVGILISAIPFNFYAIVTLLFALFLIVSGRDFGPMKQSEERALRESLEVEPLQGTVKSPALFLIPLGLLVVLTLVFMLLDGKGDITQGSGTTGVYYAVWTTLGFMAFYYIFVAKVMTWNEFQEHTQKGIGEMASLGLILLLAFMLAEVTKLLGTGVFIAQSLKTVGFSVAFAPLAIFLSACLIAFATGTSWGTFSIMVPIGIDVAWGLGGNMPLFIGAAVAGGVFGDHCSPISDTTIISALASRCDVSEHVSTQLPYALVSASIAGIGYVIAGFWLS